MWWPLKKTRSAACPKSIWMLFLQWLLHSPLHPFPLHHCVSWRNPSEFQMLSDQMVSKSLDKVLVLGGVRKGKLKIFHLRRETAGPCLAVHSFPIWIQSCENVETVKIWAANTGKLWSGGMGRDLQSLLNAKVIDSGWKLNSLISNFLSLQQQEKQQPRLRNCLSCKNLSFLLYLRQKFFRPGLCQKADFIWAKPVVLFLNLEVRGNNNNNSNNNKNQTPISFFFLLNTFAARVWKVTFHVGTALTEELCLSQAQGTWSLIWLNYWC